MEEVQRVGASFPANPAAGLSVDQHPQLVGTVSSLLGAQYCARTIV
jgi:hypothetical protein